MADTKDWPYSEEMPFTPEQWAKSPTKMEKWNQGRIEATFKALSLEAAETPSLKERLLVSFKEREALITALNEMRADYETTLHALKAAAGEIKRLLAELEASNKREEQAKAVEQELTKVSMDLDASMNSHTRNRALTSELHKRYAALGHEFWRLRKAAMAAGVSGAVLDEATEAFKNCRDLQNPNHETRR